MTLSADGMLRYYKVKDVPADEARLPRPLGEINIRWVSP